MAAFSIALVLMQGTFPGDVPGTEIGAGLPPGYEPSGAVWHSGRNQLLVVSDDGLVSAMNADGSDVQHWTLPGDLEGITCADPDSDVVYVGREHPDAVLEFDLSTSSLLRSFDLSATLTGPSNSGLEALTFVPIEGHPEGGVFHAGLQSDGRIYVFDLPILTSASSTAVTHLDTITPAPGLSDLSGLDFDRSTQILYAIFDSANRMLAMDAAGNLLAQWSLLPGNDQEGIALEGCKLYVAEDVGPEVWVYENFPDASGCHTLFVDTATLSISAGGAQTLTLDAGSAYELDLYLLLGSASGTSPGISVDSFVLPLNIPDAYFSYTLLSPNTGLLASSLGILGSGGTATASFHIPAGLAPASLVGVTLNHAYLVFDNSAAVVLASNPAPLTLGL